MGRGVLSCPWRRREERRGEETRRIVGSYLSMLGIPLRVSSLSVLLSFFLSFVLSHLYMGKSLMDQRRRRE
jgi:hypothetical protein